MIFFGVIIFGLILYLIVWIIHLDWKATIYRNALEEVMWHLKTKDIFRSVDEHRGREDWDEQLFQTVGVALNGMKWREERARIVEARKKLSYSTGPKKYTNGEI